MTSNKEGWSKGLNCQVNEDEGLRTHCEAKNWVGPQKTSQIPSGDVHQDLYQWPMVMLCATSEKGRAQEEPKVSVALTLSDYRRQDDVITEEFYLPLRICKNSYVLVVVDLLK